MAGRSLLVGRTLAMVPAAARASDVVLFVPSPDGQRILARHGCATPYLPQ